MPPVTVSDAVTLYAFPKEYPYWGELENLRRGFAGFPPAEEWEHDFFDYLHNHLEETAEDSLVFRLTTQAVDLFGTERPYECARWVSLLAGSPPLRRLPLLGFAIHGPTTLQPLQRELRKLLDQRLLSSEVKGIQEAVWFVNALEQRVLVSHYRQGM